MSVHEVLGKYAHMAQDLNEQREIAIKTRDVWKEQWYKLWGDMQEARDEARYWHRKYNMLIADTRIGPADQSWVMPDAVGVCKCSICASQDIQGDDLAGTLAKKNSIDNSS